MAWALQRPWFLSDLCSPQRSEVRTNVDLPNNYTPLRTNKNLSNNNAPRFTFGYQTKTPRGFALGIMCLCLQSEKIFWFVKGSSWFLQAKESKASFPGFAIQKGVADLLSNSFFFFFFAANIFVISTVSISFELGIPLKGNYRGGLLSGKTPCWKNSVPNIGPVFFRLFKGLGGFSRPF